MPGRTPADLVARGQGVHHLETAMESVPHLGRLRPIANSVGCKIAPRRWAKTIDGVTFRDIDVVKKPINLHGKSATANIVGVHFDQLTVQGKAVTSQMDSDAT
jgi:hypothetical protein